MSQKHGQGTRQESAAASLGEADWESPSKRTRSGQGLKDDSNSGGTEGGGGAARAVMGVLEGGAVVPAV